MKSLPLFFAFAIFSSLTLAQDPAPPADPAAKPAPAEPVAPKADPAPTPAELAPLPDPSPAGDPELMRNQPGDRVRPDPMLVPRGVPSKPPKFDERQKNRSTLKPPATSKELETRIKFRQAHSRAASEPAIQALWEESRQAGTDYEKRDALRRYYDLLYKRMASFDKSIVPLVTERRKVSIRRLDQTRIEPTDPLDEEHRQRQD